jgi:hypothetical protein
LKNKVNTATDQQSAAISLHVEPLEPAINLFLFDKDTASSFYTFCLLCVVNREQVLFCQSTTNFIVEVSNKFKEWVLLGDA